MSLPATIDYVAPALAEIPPSRAAWALYADRSAVLVHDLQRYFLRPYAAECSALRQAIARTAVILSSARSAGVPVYYTAQRGNQDQVARGLQRDLWGPGMQAVPEHTDIIDAVAPVAGEQVLVKHRYSAFAKSDLAEQLAQQGRDQLVITGVYAHIGITATAFEAFQREIHPFVVADAVADFGRHQHELALSQIASCCGVVLGTDDVVTTFDAAAVARAEPLMSTPIDESSIDSLVRTELCGHLGDDPAAAAFTDPESDLFALGLDSLRAFELLDLLADAGVDVDYGEFVCRPTIAFLREQALAVNA